MEHTLTEYLINAVWQLPLLAGGAWFLLRMIQPRPQVQYCVWLAVLGLAVLLPAWGINRTDGLAAPTAPLLTPQGLTGATSQPANGQLPAHGFLSPALLHRIHPVRLGKHYVRWLVRLYLATMIFALLHVAQAWRASWLLASRAAHCHAHRTALADCSRRFSMKPPQVRESSEITSPMIAGIWSPVLLLPANFASFSEEEVTAALCHELAHIKRRDSLVNLACQLASMPLLWHPATHLIQRRIRMTREMACDLMAAQEMKSDMIYARCLLALANRMLGTRAVATPHGYLGLLGNHSLEERIMRLTEKTTMGLRAQMCRLAAGAAIMSASLILAATVHLAPAMAAPATNLALSTEVLLSQEPPVATPPASSSADQQRWSREKEKARLRQRSEAAGDRQQLLLRLLITRP